MGARECPSTVRAQLPTVGGGVFVIPQYREEENIYAALAVLAESAAKYGIHEFASLEQSDGLWMLAGHPWRFRIASPASDVLDDMLARGLGPHLKVRLELPLGTRAEAPMYGPPLREVIRRWVERGHASSAIARWQADQNPHARLYLRANDEPGRLQLQLWEYASSDWTSLRYAHIYLSQEEAVLHADPGDIDWSGSEDELRDAFHTGAFGNKDPKTKLWQIDPPAEMGLPLDIVVGWLAHSFRSNGEALAFELFGDDW